MVGASHGQRFSEGQIHGRGRPWLGAFSEAKFWTKFAWTRAFGVFGPENGVGTRSAIGMGSLPGNIAVEIEAVFEVTD